MENYLMDENINQMNDLLSDIPESDVINEDPLLETAAGEIKKVNIDIIDGGTDGSSVPDEKPKKTNPFLKFIRSEYQYIIAFFIPVIILFAAYAVFRVHPFGDMSVLVLDLNGQYVYYFENLRDVLHGNGSPFISWSRNLSGEIMGIFAYYLASPFTLIPMVLPRSMMTESLLIMQLCKVGTAAVTFNYYLKHSKNRPFSNSLIFSMLYALMGYMIVQLMNPMWLDGLIYLPLICYGIEKIIDENRWIWFIVPLALMYVAHFYIGWMITFFSIIYFLYYYFAGKKPCRPSKNGKAAFKKFFIAGMKFAVGGFLAAACAAWVLIPLYYSLKLGKFDFTTPNYSVKTQFEMLDFFKNILPNVYDTCRPEGSPVVYCGVLTILMVPLFFLNSKIEFKQKMGLGIVLTVVLMSMYISTADLAWHGFQVPNWLPFRYSFTFSFVMLLMASEAFEKCDGFTPKDIAGTAAAVIVYALYIGKQGLDGVSLLFSVWFTVLFIVIYAVFVRFISLAPAGKRSVLSYIMCVLIVGELFGSTLSNLNAINKDVVYSKYSSYNRYITLGRETVQKIYKADSFEDSGFYRIEKNYHRTVNDPMAFGTFGLSHSSSTLNAAPIQFLRRLGFSYGGHYIKYKGSTMVSDALFGIKYIMDKEDVESEKMPEDKTYTDLLLLNKDEKEIWGVYENPYALPLAFMADEAVADVELGLDNPFTNQNRLLGTILSGEYVDFFKEIDIDRIVPENADKTSYGAHTKYVPHEIGKNSHIEFLFTAPTTDMIYCYFPSSYERKVNLWLDKEFLDYYFEGGNMAVQTLGRFEKGQDISLIMTITEEKNEVLFSNKEFYYLDEALFSDAVDTIRSRGMNIESWSEDHIKGSVDAEKDGILFTTISWEPGWTIKVDGQKAEPVKVCDALIGVPVSEGSHTIEMTFFPKGLGFGLLISAAGIITVIMLAWAEKDSLKKEKNRKA